MKIALVSQEYPPETAKGGIGTQTYLKAHGLSKLKNEVFIISRSIDNIRRIEKDGNITLIRVGGFEEMIPEMNEPTQWVTYSLAIATELYQLNANEHLDIIDFPEWGAEGYIFFINRTENNYIPAVIQLHGPLIMLANTINWPDKKTTFYKQGIFMEASCVQLADGIYSSSQCSAEWIRKYYDESRLDIPIIHLGIDLDLFSPKPINKSEELSIIFAGKLVPNKGVEELTIACVNLKRYYPNLKLKLIGKGETEFVNKLKKHATTTPDLLDFIGFLNKEELRSQFSKSTLFAAPSWYEGGPGFVYLEAMACGLPVIGCTGSGVEEIIIDGFNGFLVPPQDIMYLEATLKRVLGDSRLRNFLSENAIQFVKKEADTEVCTRKLLNYYKSVLTNIKSPGR